MKPSTHFFLLMSGVCAFSGQAHAVIPLVSGFHIGGRADANDQDGSFTQVVFHQDQTGTLNPLGGSIRAEDFDLINPGHSLAVTSEGSATWADAAHGTVTWRNMGWERNTIATSAATLNKFVSGPVWYYIFEATFDGILTLDYDVRATGDPFALAGLTIGWDGPGGGLDLYNPDDPTAQGTFTRSVTAGTEYILRLDNEANFVSSAGIFPPFGKMDADFTWRIEPIPEPSALALLALTGMGLARRRREVSLTSWRTAPNTRPWKQRGE